MLGFRLFLALGFVAFGPFGCSHLKSPSKSDSQDATISVPQSTPIPTADQRSISELERDGFAAIGRGYSLIEPGIRSANKEEVMIGLRLIDDGLDLLDKANLKSDGVNKYHLKQFMKARMEGRKFLSLPPYNQ